MVDNNRLLVVLLGGTGSGKDTILNNLLEICPEADRLVYNTTRPQRDGEVDGVTYHFKTPEQFASDITSGDIIECRGYAVAGGSSWYYYTKREDLNVDSKYIITQMSADQLNAVKYRIPEDMQILPVFLNIAKYIRKQRIAARGTEITDELNRRLNEEQIELNRLSLEADIEHRTYNTFVINNGYAPAEQISFNIWNIMRFA